MAILNPDSNGLKRKISSTQLNKYKSISNLLNAPNVSTIIPEQIDMDWWKNVASKLRNKSAHYLIPTLLRIFTTKDYAPENYILTKDDGTPQHALLHDWGSFFHKTDYHIAIRFFKESTDQLQKIINNTQWKSDLSWWKSQAEYYNMFFEYQWTIDNMKNSLNVMYRDFFQKEDESDEDSSEKEGHRR